MRLFRSKWTYMAWFALTAHETYRDVTRFSRQAIPLSQLPLSSSITFIAGDLYCLVLMIYFFRATSNRLEKTGLTLYFCYFLAELANLLHRLGAFRWSLPRHGLAFLSLDGVISLAIAARLAQLFREPQQPALMDPTPR